MFPEGFGIHVTLAIITDKGDLQRGALTQPVAELYLLIFVPLSLFFPPRSSYYDFLLMHRGGLCDCLAIMGLCLINHVDPLCFTSKAAALRLINGDQGPLKRRLVTDSVHLDTQGPPCRQRRGPANT